MIYKNKLIKYMILFLFQFFIHQQNYGQTNLSKIKIALHWQPQAQFAGYYIAEEKGYFKKHNLDVQLIHTGINNSADGLLLNNNVDYATMFLSTAIRHKGEGYKFENIMQFSQKSALLFISKKTSGIDSPEKFRNKKVGVWRAGFDEIPRLFCEMQHINVEYVPIEYTPDLFLMDGIDVMIVMWYNEYNNVLLSGINEDELNTFFLADYNLDIPEDGLYAVKGNKNINNEINTNLITAISEGWNYAFSHREEAIDLVLKEMQETKIQANRAHQVWMLDRIYDVFHPEDKTSIFGILNEKDFNNTVQIMINLHIIKEKIPYSDFVWKAK